MSSPDIQLADELVADINTFGWSAYALVAKRVWVPEWEPRKGELNTLRCGVIPGLTPKGSIAQGERERPFTEWPIGFCFAGKLNDKTRDEVDAFANVIEELRQRYCSTIITTDDGREFFAINFQYIARFDPSQLDRIETEADDEYAGTFSSALLINFQLLDN